MVINFLFRVIEDPVKSPNLPKVQKHTKPFPKAVPLSPKTKVPRKFSGFSSQPKSAPVDVKRPYTGGQTLNKIDIERVNKPVNKTVHKNKIVNKPKPVHKQYIFNPLQQYRQERIQQRQESGLISMDAQV